MAKQTVILVSPPVTKLDNPEVPPHKHVILTELGTDDASQRLLDNPPPNTVVRVVYPSK